MQPISQEWAEVYQLPSAGNMMGTGPHARGVFIRQGTRMATTLVAKMHEYHPDRILRDLDILDFGCGVGRVAMPLYCNYQIPSACCDVDPAAIEFLKRQIPSASPVKTDYHPPAPFADASFHIIYSVSVWTHLPPDLQIPWLKEIRRLLRPGGIALITTSSYTALATRREQLPDWKNVADDDLKREGFIFKPAGATPGVTGTYGYVLHSSEYIRQHWAPVFDVIEQCESAIENVQDLNVLKKP